MKQEKKQENMSVWNAAAQPPKEVLRKIPKGRLAGKSDISPQWRYKTATELFGPCGVGWKYTIDRLWLESCDPEIVAFAQISLWIKQQEEWSEPIPGVGGSKLVVQETRGLHVNDEAYKMATTDALSVAFKVLGFGADIYLGLWDGSKYHIPQEQNSKLTDWLVSCEAASAATVDEYIQWWPKNKPKIITDCGQEGAVKVYEAFKEYLEILRAAQ